MNTQLRDLERRESISPSPDKLNAERSETFLDRLMSKNFDLYCQEFQNKQSFQTRQAQLYQKAHSNTKRHEDMARLDTEKYEKTSKAYEGLMKSHEERVHQHKQELIAKNVQEIQMHEQDRKIKNDFE